ncbi:rna-directed dna polymerase from mobile element jockey-like protein [Lasius niger]|uniref:Rna-directed dna polymerase from mobile element jockey-like protein n=1 Tax=Lasius niger TaxID=67767 RepID=A0A0J7KGA8_LASNI|nr:rna-directed dna polymerase from mobile element jockey-like protein [Lasius niger]
MGKQEGKMTAVFIDLKAAFDTVDREAVVKAMQERGVREGLVVRVEEMLRETKSRVRAGKRIGEKFWTARGVRQVCPISPTLFNILIADLEEEMERGGWGGVRLGERKIYTLSYADDVVLMAEEEQDMRAMGAFQQTDTERHCVTQLNTVYGCLKEQYNSWT